MDNWLFLLIVFGSAALAVIYGIIVLFWLKKQLPKDGASADLSRLIRKGSITYLNNQYKAAVFVASVLFLAIGFFIGWKIAVGYLIGVVVSILIGYIGINISIRANLKTAVAQKNGLSKSFSTAFKSGSAIGFFVVAIGLLVVAGTYFIFNKDVNVLIGLGLGAGLISIFSRIGGGIYTKSADIGTSLAAETNPNISEDNLKNPGIVADQIGDNVGDCAGTVTDVFETYIISFMAGVLLGSLTAGTTGSTEFPFLLGGVSILSSMLGILFVRIRKSGSIISALYRGLVASVFFSAIGFYFVSKITFGAGYFKIYLASLIGLLVIAFITIVTAYYTDKKFNPAKSIAKAAQMGHGLNVISGISVGMESVFFPAIIISAAILGSYLLAGSYGVALACVSMLSLAGTMVSIDALGPIADNAKGICEADNQPEDVMKSAESLDAAGNTVKAVTKGYVIASAGLSVFAIFSGFVIKLGGVVFNLNNPGVLVGLILGAAVVYLFGSLILRAVKVLSVLVIGEISGQFKGGNSKPEYERVINLISRSAIKKMIAPALIPIVGVLIVGFGFGAETLGGFLIGIVVSGILMSLSMTAGGAAWDNAAKFIKEGHLGGKNSDSYKAAITGDVVGDAYKDAVGPAISPMIKVASVLALLIANLLK